MTDTQISRRDRDRPGVLRAAGASGRDRHPRPEVGGAARATREGRLGRRLLRAARLHRARERRDPRRRRRQPVHRLRRRHRRHHGRPHRAARRRRPPPTSCRTSSTRSSRSPPTRSTCASPSCSPSTRPATAQKKSVLVNSGAEAVENGVKIARKYTGRRGVAVLDHAYHGRTNLTMAMNYKAHALRDRASARSPATCTTRPSSYPYRDGLSGADAAARTIALPREDRRRERPRLPRRRAHPGRGRLHGARRGLPPRAAGVVHRATASS